MFTVTEYAALNEIKGYPKYYIIMEDGLIYFRRSCSLNNYDKIGIKFKNLYITGPRSAVGNVSGNRCESDCRSRGREFDPGPVPYFHGD